MSAEEWQVIRFTLWVSGLATLLAAPFGMALAWLLARKDWPGKIFVETLVTLPLVMPPVATGLILLKLFGRRGPVGAFLENQLGVEIVFTWKAVLIALAVMSFPLLVRTMRVGFEQVPARFEQVARTLGASPPRVFFEITLPLAARGIAAGTILGFARCLGEFGATIMVAGAIPGVTETLSVSIFQHIQLGQDAPAFRLLALSIAFSFAALWGGEILMRRRPAA
jgi:molybdate transport system permease protein